MPLADVPANHPRLLNFIEDAKGRVAARFGRKTDTEMPPLKHRRGFPLRIRDLKKRILKVIQRLADKGVAP